MATLQSVLVTGGSGFIGSSIVNRLLDESTEASPIQISVVSRNPKTHDPRVNYHSVDITKADEIKTLFSEIKPQVVIHTVSPEHLDIPALEPTNIGGTKVLLDVAKASPWTRAFVYTSSDSVCQPTTHQITESQVQLWDSKHYNNIYGKSKAMADRMVLAANSPELLTCSLRIPIIYGENDYNLIPMFFSSIEKNEHKTQVGANKNNFEHCYVKSVAEAHVLAAKALLLTDAGLQDPDKKVDGEAFFISDDASRPFYDFSRDCYAAAGSPVADAEIKSIPIWVVQILASMGEWIFWIATFGSKKPKLSRQDVDYLAGGTFWSIEKAKSRLGYKPVLEQDQAIKASVWGYMERMGMSLDN